MDAQRTRRDAGMKPALQLRLGQTLALTPQLQQAIRLLQLSRTELELELNLAVESNPLLDMEAEAEGEAPAEAAGEAAVDGEGDGGEIDYEPGEQPLDFELEDGSLPSRASAPDDGTDSHGAAAEDLHDHLLWQLNLTPLSPRDHAIGTAIIEAIDDDGYLIESSEALCHALAPLRAVTEGEIEAMRHRIQHFDPIGVASRSLQECLAVQLGEFDPGTAGLDTARRLVDAHLDDLARRDRSQMHALLGCSDDEFDAALALIRSLAPKPGSGYSAAAPEFIAPDAYARKLRGRWQASLASGSQPRLTINEHYAGLIAKVQRDDARYLRGQLQEARWLIKSLQARADTILKVASAIVRAQEGFLEFGPEAMRPLVLKEVADEVGLHESTISRVTTRKYLHTPRGTFEFKYFFSSSLGTADGGAASATAVQAMLRKLIDDEPPARPLSDQALANELRQRGIHVARRTVAKYREAMRIPASSERGRPAP